ncbi:hypothetical protein [Burkholderia ubonensis]
MGFDAPRSLGPREYGAHTALPIWLRYMQDALQSVPVPPPAPASEAAISADERARIPGYFDSP